MAIEAIQWALAQRTGATAKLVLLVLADHADRTGYCWPGIDRLITQTELSRRTIIRMLEQLEKQRLLLRKRRANQSNTYQLALDQCASVTPTMCQPDTMDVPTCPVGSVTVTPKPSKNHQKPSVNLSKAKRSTRMSEDWQPDEALVSWARASFPIVESIDDETDRFRDYWIAKGDARADWRASWRNWMRNAAKFAARSRPATKLDGIARRNAEQINAAMARHGIDEGLMRPARPALRLVE